MARVGGAPKCPTCSKSVYAAEQILGPGGTAYHRLCFKCSVATCRKMLDSATMAEKDGTLFCKGCYAKAHGPKGYGFAGGGASLMAETGVTVRVADDEPPTPSAAPPRASPAERPAAPPPSAAAASPRAAPPPGPAKFGSSVAAPKAAAGGGARFGSAAPKCPTCSKSVYEAEKQLGPGGVAYHKACFICSVDSCRKRLDSMTMSERDNVLFCNGCYGARFGAVGFGAARSRTQHEE